MKYCDDCMAYYSGNHTCPEWIKILVKKSKEKDNINFNTHD